MPWTYADEEEKPSNPDQYVLVEWSWDGQTVRAKARWTGNWWEYQGGSSCPGVERWRYPFAEEVQPGDLRNAD